MALVIVQRVRPCPGYQVSGDGVLVRDLEEGTLLAVVDGVGHGPHAAHAADNILDYLRQASSLDLPTLMAGCDAAAVGTRGAAVGLVCLANQHRRLHYLGVGNISATLWLPRERTLTLVSQNGLVGRLRKIPRVQEHPTEDHQLLLLHSDGLSTHAIHELMQSWDGDLQAHADRLMADASKRDDASLLLVQIRHPTTS